MAAANFEAPEATGKAIPPTACSSVSSSSSSS
eukprot:CAMPEP_0114165030 /NCGR_PEP_ID=MMETSP0043_2-20121206/31011_1 /TAXON_ID=464988 /ORGANISM="Hemiselmis andersenii, Strain CCMP644" /LENGTH=31 /DNA_ID= /DNA_START= /DNA_END= /DNA_ORIENTATION=